MSDVTYSVADDAEMIAQELIPKYHAHLSDNGVTVRCLFRDDLPKSKGKIKWGEAKKITGLDCYLAAAERDFLVILLTQQVWQTLTERQKFALVDHELAHCWAETDENGDLKLSTIPHDLEEFDAIVRRYGQWRSDVKNFAQALQEAFEFTPS
jgi:hypothetical protein